MSDSFSNTNDPSFSSQSTADSAASRAAEDLRSASEQPKQKAAKFKESAVEKAQQFRQYAGQKTKQFSASASEKASHFKEVAGDRGGRFKEAAEGQWQETRVRAQEVHSATEEYIRQNPTRSILTAAGVGLFLGLIIRR